jgi:ATP-binding cassette subfamily B protein
VARAILVDPAILVFDNALSNVDAETERTILDGLRSRPAAAQESTLIVASNRIGAVQDADRIFVMDEGRIVDSGTHDELVGRPGLYARMFERQRLSAELEEL